MVTRSQTNSLRPTTFHDGTSKWPLPSALVTNLSTIPETPAMYTIAKQYPEWREAMAKEFQALLPNQTWTLIPASQATNTITCKWSGIDFEETFSPVVKATTVRTVLAFVVSRNWFVHQHDVQNAFLHGPLHEMVFMAQPPGFSHPQYPSFVYKLNKAIYGLRQSPRVWYARLTSRLVDLGFTISGADSSLFIYQSAHITTFVLVYVDDLLITGSSMQFIYDLVAAISCDFPITNLVKLSYFLGVEASYNSEGLLLTQHKYIIDILHYTNMRSAKPVKSPVSTSKKLSAFSKHLFEDPTLYRSTVGSFQYLSFTRSDLAFAVGKVYQFMHSPRVPHWQAVKRILRYIKHISTVGLQLSPSSPTQLTTWSYVNWEGCPDDRRSTRGYCIFLGSNLISWSSKKQPTVARSSIETKFKVLAIATAEVIYLQHLGDKLSNACTPKCVP
ncbi:hypothetical protein F2P56_023397 [Juglans regia]|uniref:Reverse transcriptase Ty1/copia-type domain-containing protein n=1 Tax=Juglans regia TaxID=51240 RepID=A0A833UKK4_JUGRE|nr:hypothetical protein F2P56_023397 [Juglans regia]